LESHDRSPGQRLIGKRKAEAVLDIIKIPDMFPMSLEGIDEAIDALKRMQQKRA
jgi:hypothetical protein